MPLEAWSGNSRAAPLLFLNDVYFFPPLSTMRKLKKKMMASHDATNHDDERTTSCALMAQPCLHNEIKQLCPFRGEKEMENTLGKRKVSLGG